MHQLCHGRRLLTDGVINADHILALLVQDGVNGNRGLTGLTVADDQLTLATPNGEPRVNGQNTGCHRGIYHNGGCRFFNRAVVIGLDLALTVDRLAQSVDNTANKALAYRHAGTLMGTHSGRTLVDLAILTKQDATDLVLLNILDHALDPGVKHHDLAVHGVVHTVNGGNAVAYANDLARAHFLCLFRTGRLHAEQLRLNRACFLAAQILIGLKNLCQCIHALMFAKHLHKGGKGRRKNTVQALFLLCKAHSGIREHLGEQRIFTQQGFCCFNLLFVQIQFPQHQRIILCGYGHTGSPPSCPARKSS